ncbi:MAG: hypothetical protein O3C39_10275 [Planctomycetota bacterium]|jgi:hypothetical protein|nr:hypothetical protein [Planctomycetota bacterium]MDA1202056.1 hypothetical protein [Planctomycetota bacterium]
MGIIAFCPNHHRIKVKDHLAGKKGICPHCGARFRIPTESEPAAPAEASPPAAAVRESAAADRARPMARFVSLDAEWAATLPRALPLADPDR